MIDVAERARWRAAASALHGRGEELATQLADRHFARHPEAAGGWGKGGPGFTRQDVRLQVEFAAAALELASPSGFADFVRWTVRVLAARGIGSDAVAESLELLHEAAGRLLAADQMVPLASVLAAGRAAAAGSSATAAGGGRAPAAEAVTAYLQAVLAGRRDAAVAVALGELEHGRSVADVYVDVLQEAQVEVGRLWESNRITVAREHMATALTQLVMAQLYPRLERGAERRGRAVVTGVEGELHQVGAQMVADIVEADGWEVRFLGCGSPHRGVLDAIAEHQADAVGVSVALFGNVPRARGLIAEIRGLGLARRPAVVVGGAALKGAPELCRELGADGFAVDLRGAAAAFRQVTPAA